jgi:hypothetical protein
VSIDSTVAHGGRASVKVHGGAGYCDHAFVQSKAIAALGSKVYGRFYVRFEGAFPTGQASHITFAAIQDVTDGEDLRLGGQYGYLLWNRATSDSRIDITLPNTKADATTVKPASGTWTCVEFAIDGDQGTLHSWVDGTDAGIPGLQADGTRTAGLDDWWYSSPWTPKQLGDLRLGWESYANAGANTVWFDDVALGSARIGCQ